MTISQTLSETRAGVLAHLGAVRPSDSHGKSDFGPSGSPARNMPQGNRRMVAVTVAISEPLDAAPIDWGDTIAANLRLIYRNTTVEIIDTWRADA